MISYFFQKKQLVFLQVIIANFLLFGLTLVTDSQMYLGFEIPKVFVFNTLTPVFAILCLTNSLLFDLRLPAPRSIWQTHRAEILILAIFIIWCIVATILSPNLLTSIFGNYDKRMGLISWANLIIFGLCMIHTLYFAKRSFLAVSMWFALAVASVHVLYSAKQIWIDRILEVTEDKRPSGLFGQSNYMAGYFLQILPLMVLQLWHERSDISKLLTALTIAISIICIAVAQSRAATIILALTILASSIYFLRQTIEIKKLKLVASIALIPLLGLLAVLNPRLLDMQLQDSTRLLIWKSSTSAIAQRPWTGYGFDVAGYILPTHMYAHGLDRTVAVDRAHSEYLDLALNAGLPALVMFVIFNILMFAKISQKLNHESLVIGLMLFVFLARSLVDVNGISNYALYVASIAWFFEWRFGSLSETIFQSNHAFIKIVLPVHEAKTLSSKDAKNFIYHLIILYFVIQTIASTYLYTHQWQAERYYKNYQAKPTEIENIAQASYHNPFEERYALEHLSAKLTSSHQFDLEEIIPKYIQSQTLHNSEYYFRIGLFYAQNNQNEIAKSYLKQAIILASPNQTYQQSYAELK